MFADTPVVLVAFRSLIVALFIKPYSKSKLSDFSSAVSRFLIVVLSVTSRSDYLCDRLHLDFESLHVTRGGNFPVLEDCHKLTRSVQGQQVY